MTQPFTYLFRLRLGIKERDKPTAWPWVAVVLLGLIVLLQ